MRTATSILVYMALPLLGIAMAASCTKASSSFIEGRDVGEAILFAAEDGDMETIVTPTKADAVTSLSSFYAAATRGTAGSETSKWTSTQFNSDGAETPTYAAVSPGKWWPYTDESYHFYASNLGLTFNAAGTSVSVPNASTDVVVAYMPSPIYKDKNTLTFNHVFARIGNVTVSAASGYTISNISIKITPKISGTYNIRTGNGQTDDTGWSGTSNGTVCEIANATPGTKSNNIYLIPGSYTLTATWNAVRGDYSHTYTNISSTATVALEKGKVNAIAITLGGNAEELTFGVSVTAWGTLNKTALFNEPGIFGEVPQTNPLIDIGEK